MKKIISMIMVLVLILVGCGAGGNDGPQTGVKAVEPSGGEQLVVVGADDTSEGMCLQNSLSKYSEEYDVEVNYIEAPYGDATAKIQNLIRSNESPDLVRLSGWVDIGEDYLTDMSEVTDLANFNEELLRQGQSPDGTQVALPMNYTANGFIYNKELFTKAGITPPTFDDLWTWDEFDAANVKLQEAGAKFGYVVDYSQFRLATMIYTDGGQWYDVENKEVKINSPENFEIIDSFVQDMKNGVAPKATWVSSEDPSALFETGTTGMYLAGNWKITPFDEGIGFDWGVMPMPEGSSGSSSNIGMNFLYLTKDSANQSTAAHYLSWLFEPDNYTTFVKDCNYIPSTTNIGEIEYDLSENGNQAIKDFTTQAQSVNPASVDDNVFSYTNFVGDNIIREEISAAINGDKTTEQALNDAANRSLEYIVEDDDSWTLKYPTE